MNNIKKYILILIFSSTIFQVAQANQSWRFKVYYDNTEIGEHLFKVTPMQNKTNVVIEADFNVSLFFINAYNYQHTNYESWNGNCLSSIHSSTDDNGEVLHVQGKAKEDGFFITTASGKNTVQGCVKSFAYWDASILKSTELLNPQTGELMPVEITFVGEETLIVRGLPTRTKRYTLVTEEFKIDLWYSVSNEWLALNSTTADGETLRYQIQ